MSDATEHTATGTLAGIMEKTGGWHEIHVAIPGKQYPLKLSTKLPALVELARATGEQVMEWRYKEQDSGNPNPNRPGSNYVNRYFEGVAPVGTTPQNAPDATAASNAPSQTNAGQSGGLTKEEWAAKDSAAHKRACIAIAVSALGPVGDLELNTYLERVWHLATAFHANVIATRDDPTGEGVPF